MPDDRPSEVLGSLPRTRPHRRSEKRRSPAAGPTGPQAADGERRPPADTPKPQAADTPKPARTANSKPRRAANSTSRRTGAPKAVRSPRPQRLGQPAQPAGTPSAPRTRKPIPPSGTQILGTAVQAAAELAEIGLSVSARALRRAVSRLPRP